MTTTDTAPHGRGMAWATLLVSGGISWGVNLWHAFDQAHGHVTWWFAALATLYGTAPVVLAAFQSHSAAFVPMGKAKRALTYLLVLLGMVLSVQAQAAAVAVFAGEWLKWVFPVLVDLSAFLALHTLMASLSTPETAPAAEPTGARSDASFTDTSDGQETTIGDSPREALAAEDGDSGAKLATAGTSTGGAADDRKAAERAPVARQRPARSGGKSRASGKRTRRSMTEWVELAGPLFHAEMTRLHRQPTGDEFAEAIRKAGLGSVSASTAKNIRTEILDRAPVPALDDLS